MVGHDFVVRALGWLFFALRRRRFLAAVAAAHPWRIAVLLLPFLGDLRMVGVHVTLLLRALERHRYSSRPASSASSPSLGKETPARSARRTTRRYSSLCQARSP